MRGVLRTRAPPHARCAAGRHTGRVDLGLSEGQRAVFEQWVEGVSARALESLTFAEIRKGVQALSSLYVERRRGGRIAERSVEGRGKRAAFASYYAPLHFLTAVGVLRETGGDFLDGVSRVHDLGCGTGAAGAAVVAIMPQRLEVRALDRSGWALKEAAHSYAAFGAPARVKRGVLPRDLPRSTGAGDLLLLGWLVNELADAQRDALLSALLERVEGGAKLLLLEPLSGAISPWWKQWLPRFEAAGIAAGQSKWEIERPDWVVRMDRASLLNHRSVGARYLFG